MAAKTPTRSSRGQQNEPAPDAPQVSSSEQQARSTSPTMAGLITRVEEKKNLQNLNDRLAAYIDRVRRLEVENRTLTSRITTSQESSTREVTSLKSLYEKEIHDSRLLLDTTASEKAKLQLDLNRARSEVTDANNR